MRAFLRRHANEILKTNVNPTYYRSNAMPCATARYSLIRNLSTQLTTALPYSGNIEAFLWQF
jgi:hypothetical protein